MILDWVSEWKDAGSVEKIVEIEYLPKTEQQRDQRRQRRRREHRGIDQKRRKQANVAFPNQLLLLLERQFLYPGFRSFGFEQCSNRIFRLYGFAMIMSRDNRNSRSQGSL